MRTTYRARRDVLIAMLKHHLPNALSFEIPSGGIALWALVAEGIDDEGWVAAARMRGVGLRTGREFSATDEPVRGLRLVFSRMDEEELAAAVRELAFALPAAGPMPPLT
jgi:GntR family transcriptional regulator/MocR family aminotransferase